MSEPELRALLAAWVAEWRASEPGSTRRKIAADVIEHLEHLTFGTAPHALGCLLEF